MEVLLKSTSFVSKNLTGTKTEVEISAGRCTPSPSPSGDDTESEKEGKKNRGGEREKRCLVAEIWRAAPRARRIDTTNSGGFLGGKSPGSNFDPRDLSRKKLA